MRTVLFGNNLAAVNALHELLAARHEVICVVPFRHRIHAWHESLFEAARTLGIASIFNPEDVNDSFLRIQLARFRPDLLLSVYYDQRLGPEVLGLARLGAFNIHPSLLPAYRGVAPIIWALVCDEKRIGVTLHEMVQKFDAGDILCQENISVEDSDTGFSLHQKAAMVAKQIVHRFLADPHAMIAAKRPQVGEGSYFSQRAAQVNLINWRDNAARIRNIVRALTEPLPCAYSYLQGRRIILLEVDVSTTLLSLPPGTLSLTERDELLVATGRGTLALRRVRVAGVEVGCDRDHEAAKELLLGHQFDRGAPDSHPPATRLPRYVHFGVPSLGAEEEAEVLGTLRSGWIGMGEKTLSLEQAFSEMLGVPCLSYNSCTSALFLALKTLPLAPGDEVITTPLTFAATANVIEHLGATTVFADIDPITLNLDPRRVEEKVTPRTRAILPVHFGGLSCDMESLERIAARHGLAIIEDAAHALGGLYRGSPIGGRGHLAAFSLYANKNITTAEGGILAGVDQDRGERLRRLRLHGLSVDAYQRFQSKTLILSQVIEPGYKMNLTDLQAAIGLAQLRKFPSFQQRRQALARIYDSYFQDDLPLRRQPRPALESPDRHALHLYVILVDEARLTLSRNEIVQMLRDRNVGVGIHYEALFYHPYYRERYGLRPEDFPNAATASRSTLTLPLFPNLTDDEAKAIGATVVDVIRWSLQ